MRDADLAACSNLLRRGSRSFHAAALLLPPSVRRPATALYAFCRLADDAVDGKRRSPAALARLSARLARIYEGRPDNHPCDRVLAAVVATHGLPRALPEALLEGLAWDAEGRRYRDLSALNAYAARVAGAVGAMMAVLMGVREPGPLARACDLGVAMQLTNIARDVGEDARMGRLYLPTEWLEEAGIDPERWLARPAFSPALGAAVARLLAAAETLYARAEHGIAALPLACRPGIAAARLIYAEIGRELERRGLDSVSTRAIVPGRRKLALLARSLAAAPFAAAGDVLAAPPLPQTRFLVQAAVAAAPQPARLDGLAARITWTIALFERLQRADRLGRSRA
ncbi:phytoene/squalene synthase family protein [Elioraea tepida]|uniref:Phytoene/squalene synthase family protein n=1 Tax=Elioraea tepida TaxID=2843330 RepID=A0A975YK87_9PROT|nr:phytoene/squalene synthase family protein [Elioraea tepida]QXM25253.1 phytoene/squalene synthase family protein [Elioraea tepida]